MLFATLGYGVYSPAAQLEPQVQTDGYIRFRYFVIVFYESIFLHFELIGYGDLCSCFFSFE